MRRPARAAGVTPGLATWLGSSRVLTIAAMADKDSRAGKRYDDPVIRSFLDRLHAPHDKALASAYAAPEDNPEIPAIMLGPSEARLLELLLRIHGTRKAVELGTLVGYSALRMAAAMGPEGRLWTIDSEPLHAEVARRNIELAGYQDRVEVLVGKAMEVLPTIEQHGPFDAVFLDADKESYHLYGAWAARHLRSGGLLIADNAYVFGNLLADTDAGRGVKRMHEEAARHFHSVCIPTPDGMLLAIKK
jgi:caffeoyl-CoA O-methyltransferase